MGDVFQHARRTHAAIQQLSQRFLVEMLRRTIIADQDGQDLAVAFFEQIQRALHSGHELHPAVHDTLVALELEAESVEELMGCVVDHLRLDGGGLVCKGCLGADGSQGVVEVAAVKGAIIVQDPESAIAPSMPKAAIGTGIQCKITPLASVGDLINTTVYPISAQLKKNS